MVTSDIGLCVLRDGFECGEHAVDDIIDFEEGDELFEFAVGDAPDFWFDVVEILDVVTEE